MLNLILIDLKIKKGKKLKIKLYMNKLNKKMKRTILNQNQGKQRKQKKKVRKNLVSKYLKLKMEEKKKI